MGSLIQVLRPAFAVTRSIFAKVPHVKRIANYFVDRFDLNRVCRALRALERGRLENNPVFLAALTVGVMAVDSLGRPQRDFYFGFFEI